MSKEEDAARQDRISSHQLAIEEQRRDYDVLERLYERTNIKNISFLAAALALLAWLYGSSPSVNSATGAPIPVLMQKLFIPQQPYGVIVYFLALGLYLFGIATLLLALKARSLSTAYDNEQEECVEEDYESYLRYMRKRYLRASKVNGASYTKKLLLVDMSFLPLLVGGIMLLLLKTFGG